MNNIKPLKGQVLLRLLPHKGETEGGLLLPDIALEDARGEKARPRYAIVLAVGKWKTTKQGLSVLPDVSVGDKVIANLYSGVKLRRSIGDNLMLTRFDDVLCKVQS